MVGAVLSAVVEGLLPLPELGIGSGAIVWLLAVVNESLTRVLCVMRETTEVRNDAARSEGELDEAKSPPAGNLFKLELAALLGALGTAIGFSDLLGLPPSDTGAMVGVGPLITNVIGVVVNVIPPYIMVTDGHMLSAENGPPDFRKQYCSKVESVDVDTEVPSDRARLEPNKELVASSSSNLDIMELSCSDGHESVHII